MNIIEYLNEKYGDGPRVVTYTEAKAFGIPYPLKTGWLDVHGEKEITPKIAEPLAQQLYLKGIRTGNPSKANYLLAGATILRKIISTGKPK